MFYAEKSRYHGFLPMYALGWMKSYTFMSVNGLHKTCAYTETSEIQMKKYKAKNDHEKQRHPKQIKKAVASTSVSR